MIDSYRQLWFILSGRDRRRVVLLMLMFTGVAVIEVAGVVSVMPFVALLTNPDAALTNPALGFLYQRFGAPDEGTFLKYIGLLTFSVVTLAILFQAVTSWAQIRFAQMRLHEFGHRLMARYLAQDYEWSFRQRSADLATKVLQETQNLVFGGLYPALHIVSRALVTVFLTLLLIALDPRLALAIAGTVILAYVALYAGIRRALGRLGLERYKANRERLRLLNEAFGGLKEIKLAGLERAYLARYFTPSRRLATREFWGEVVEELPIHLIQLLAFGGMLLIVFYLLASYQQLDQVLAILAVYAFAAFRILPSLQRIFREASKLRFNAAAIQAIYEDFQQLDARGLEEAHDQHQLDGSRVSPLPLRSEICLDRVTYRYPAAERPAVDTVSLKIPARTTAGLVGATGAGKSTTVDLLVGLLRPESGCLMVDGTEINDANLAAWQRGIGYVPQHIFLADDTVAANIAFGDPPDTIDRSAVERAARLADLHDFIVNDLPEGYSTRLGERGIRLSGGQRQRVGIARALYREPQVLVFDEATSALDNLTEQTVLDAVNRLSGRTTIILVAHRLSTVRQCDRLFLFQEGKLAAEGGYEDLMETSGDFRRMVMAGNN